MWVPRTVSRPLISAFAVGDLAVSQGLHSVIAAVTFGVAYLVLAGVLSWLVLLARSGQPDHRTRRGCLGACSHPLRVGSRPQSALRLR